jgi:hypothetical protein
MGNVTAARKAHCLEKPESSIASTYLGAGMNDMKRLLWLILLLVLCKVVSSPGWMRESRSET